MASSIVSGVTSVTEYEAFWPNVRRAFLAGKLVTMLTCSICRVGPLIIEGVTEPPGSDARPAFLLFCGHFFCGPCLRMRHLRLTPSPHGMGAPANNNNNDNNPPAAPAPPPFNFETCPICRQDMPEIHELCDHPVLPLKLSGFGFPAATPGAMLCGPEGAKLPMECTACKLEHTRTALDTAILWLELTEARAARARQFMMGLAAEQLREHARLGRWVLPWPVDASKVTEYYMFGPNEGGERVG